MPEDIRVDCASPDDIVDLMRSWKGQMPDVLVVKWETHDKQVLARLRQPAWGDDADWYQVLTVDSDRIVRLEDHPTHESAMGAIRQARAASI